MPKTKKKNCSSLLKSRLATLHYKTKTATRANINQATNTQLKTKTNNLKATIITLASSSSISYEWREECRFSNGTSRWRLHTKSTPTEPIFFLILILLLFLLLVLLYVHMWVHSAILIALYFQLTADSNLYTKINRLYCVLVCT